MGISTPLCLLPPWSPGGMQRTSVRHAVAPRLARPGRPYGLGAHRAMCVRARAADSYALSNLTYYIHTSTPVCGRLWPPPKIFFRPGSAPEAGGQKVSLLLIDPLPPEAGGRPLGSGHRPKYFFYFPQNSAGRFICMGDSDLALRGVYGALSGRFRVFSKPLPGLGLRPSGAFGALFRQ